MRLRKISDYSKRLKNRHSILSDFLRSSNDIEGAGELSIQSGNNSDHPGVISERFYPSRILATRPGIVWPSHDLSPLIEA
jgi:hypothetical protein